MTPEERLSQVEALLETAARYINRHSESIAQNQENINQLNLQMLELTRMFSELAAYNRQNQEEIRRIWEYLLGQQGNGRAESD